MLSVIMLSVIMLRVIVLSLIMMNVIMLSVIMLSVIMLNVIMPNVVTTNGVAPAFDLFHQKFVFVDIMLSVVMHNVVMTNVVAPSFDLFHQKFCLLLRKIKNAASFYFQTKKHKLNHIKRPMNAFMVWSQLERRKIIEVTPGVNLIKLFGFVNGAAEK
jgi:hypothetical protein